MNQQAMLERIAVLLSRFSESVRILNDNGEFSINTHAENVLVNILNILFETEFENVNYLGSKQYPSIDLRDKFPKAANHKRIAIQVTADESLAKVTDCLTTFIKRGLDKDYDVLYIVMLVRKQTRYSEESIDRARKNFPFNSKENILDLSDLYKMLNARNDLDEIKTVLAYLESQFADQIYFDRYWQYRSDLKDYDQSIARQYKYVDISGYSPRINNLQVKVGLEDLYVSQILCIKDNSTSIEVPISRLLMNGNKSVVLGDPGSGKSTLLKWLMYDICSHREYYPTAIPVYVRCASYAQKLLHDQIDLGAYILQTLNLKNQRVYEEGLSNGHLVLLLDGLDEISDVSLRHDVVDNINTFIAQNSECRVIATSRKIGYSETRLDAHFTHYELQAFNQIQIYEFVRNWFKAVDAETYDEEIVQQFVTRLSDSRSVFRLASTPLLLMIICLIQYQGLSLPENRIDLYSIATNTLLDNWVKKRTRYGKTALSVRQLIGNLSPVAFYMQENCDDGLIREDAFREQLIKACREKAYKKDDFQIEQEVDDLISYIKEDAGFLREVGTDGIGVGQFGFIHLTLQEYFSAIRFATKWEKGMSAEELREYVLAPYWNEVLVLAAEELYQSASDPELGCERVSRFVKSIFDTEDSINGRNRPLMLIIDILGSGTSIHYELLEQIVDRIISTRRFIRFYLDTVDHGVANDIFVEKLISAYHNAPTDENLRKSMMWYSHNPAICAALEKCLTGNDEAAQAALFNYNVVYPIAYIVTTDVFRQAITNHVNKPSTTYIPTQYTCCFVHEARNSSVAEQAIEAIQAIKRPDLRKDYAQYIHFRLSWEDIADLKNVSHFLKQELPDVDCSSLDEFILQHEPREKINALTKNAVEIILDYHGLSFYYTRETRDLLIIKQSNVNVVLAPYRFDELLSPEVADSNQFSQFIRLVISFIDQGTATFQSLQDFELYVKYYRMLNWGIEEIYHERNALLDYFFDSIGCSTENIRKYTEIFNADYDETLYDMNKRTAQLDFIIHSDLTATEKASILAWLEIGRKYRKEVHNIVVEAISDLASKRQPMPYSVNFLVQRI